MDVYLGLMPRKKQIAERTLECHRCWVPMEKQEFEIFGPNIIVDVCSKCKGIWFDKGEFGKLLKDKKLTKYLTKHIGTKSRSPMICPKCGMIMDIEKAEDIDVDVCLTCNGVWLDSGELEGLQKKSEDGFEGDPIAKQEEMDEERRYKDRTSPWHRFFKKSNKK